MTPMATNKETTLESLPVDPGLLESASRWFDISWYGLLWSGSFTALAAVATVIFLFIQFWSSGVRERHTEWRTTSLEKQTAEAKKETILAQEHIAQLNKETARLSAAAEISRAAIAEANARAVEAQLALEKYKAPRSLSPLQQSAITEAMSPFAGVGFVFSVQTDPEPIALMEQIGKVLTDAKWQWLPAEGPIVWTSPGKPQASIIAFSGISIQIDDSLTAQVGPAVIALNEALNEVGIESSTKRIVDGTEPVRTAIHIYVGKKP